jgi:hypothetical protein
MRSLPLTGFLARRRAGQSPDIIMELDRWQVTALLIAVFVFCAGAFAAGLAVGKSQNEGGIAATPVEVKPKPNAAARLEGQDRANALAGLPPDTDRFEAHVTAPIQDPHTSNPAEAARIAAHRAIQEARATGVRQVIEPGTAPAHAVPVVQLVGPADPTADGATVPPVNKAHALAVATMASENAAETLRKALEPTVPAPHRASVRRLVANGQVLFRVEVGRFTNPNDAAVFLRQFQRDSGYPVDLVDVP